MVDTQTITPRRLTGPLIATGLLMLVFAPVLGGITSPDARLATQFAAMLGPNALACWSFLRRAAAEPDERSGWRLFALGAGSTIAGSCANFAIALTPTHASVLSLMSLTLMSVAGVTQAAGVLSWPWHKSDERNVTLPLLGSLIFVASLAVLLWMFALSLLPSSGMPRSLGSSTATITRMAVLNASARTVFLGGTLVFVISEEPRRLYGPLGLMLAAVSLIVVSAIGVSHATAVGGRESARLLWIAVAQACPLIFAMAAWGRTSMRDSNTTTRFPEPPTVVLQYIPFLVVGLFLVRVDVRDREVLGWSLLAFLSISMVIVLRQVLLYRAVQTANLRLETRVRERTRHIEELQQVMLRTERLNTVALLGAGLSHDLNNLLSVIGGSAELMHDALLNGHTLCPGEVEPILTATSQAGRITKQLMAFARSGSGAVTATPVELCAAVTRSEDLLRLLLPKSVRLRLVIDAPRSIVRIPGTLLEQVLVNIVSNARDAMPRGGEVDVRLRRSFVHGVEVVVLDIADTGPGIAPELQQAIFEPYYTTKANNGNGIGLASVRALMESVGGAVSVTSQLGRGSTFSLAFPLCVDGAHDSRLRTPAIPVASMVS